MPKVLQPDGGRMGLELDSLECTMDSEAGEQAWVQTLYLRQQQLDQGWDPLQPPTGQSQGQDERVGAGNVCLRMHSLQNGMGPVNGWVVL